MKIKLIIWDLDETLWAGSLAEDGSVSLNEHRAEIIRSLNRSGVISAICSKNDFEAARRQLVELKLWEEFVFPRIDFVPKAPVLRQMIEDMQLRPENVLFVDDNPLNLNEAKFLIPDLNILDASQGDCDVLLHQILEDNKHMKKSRIAEYRMLEARVKDRASEPQSNEDFLRSCDIRVTLVMNQDNVFFKNRIAELVNRSNQMNFTKSRIDPEPFFDMLTDRIHYWSCSVFVRDKYGHHGLVGFALVGTPDISLYLPAPTPPPFLHFVFSCRIMHMGIENWVWKRLKQEWNRPESEIGGVSLKETDWIREEPFHDPSVRAALMHREAERKDSGAVTMRIMADCQSAAIAHFSGLGSAVEFDNFPRAFELWTVLANEHVKQNWPHLLVYAAFMDYIESRWKAGAEHLQSSGYQAAVHIFCVFLRSRGCRMLVVLAPENAAEEKYTHPHGVAREQVIRFNAIWRRQKKFYPELSLLELSGIATDDDMDDVRHYKTPLLRKIAEYVCSWMPQIVNTPVVKLASD